MTFIRYHLRDCKKYYRLPENKMLIFGREDKCDFQLLDPEVSREHFAIRKNTDGNFEIVDLGSRNGTWLNLRKLLNESAALTEKDIIRAGKNVFVFLEKIPRKTTQDIVDEPADSLLSDEKGYRTAMLEIVGRK